MDIFEAINTRKSVRKYTEELVPMEDIKKIIDAARKAPSSTNAQMWEFVVVMSDEIKDDMRRVISEKYDEMLSWQESKDNQTKLKTYKHYATFFAEAPVVIGVVQKPRASFMEDLLIKKGVSSEEIAKCRPDGSLLSIGAAIENLSLAAHSLGYGTCWLAAPLYAYKELQEILGTQGSDRLVSLLSLGVPLDKNQLTTPKKDLDEVMRIVK